MFLPGLPQEKAERRARLESRLHTHGNIGQRIRKTGSVTFRLRQEGFMIEQFQHWLIELGLTEGAAVFVLEAIEVLAVVLLALTAPSRTSAPTPNRSRSFLF